MDDEETVLSLLQDCLLRLGVSAECVSRGTRAIELIEDRHFDLMFLDLRMPEMDGLDVLRAVRRIDESLSVIIMTGDVTVDSAVQAMKLGAEDYLLKPLDAEILRLAMIRTTNHRRLRMEHRLLQESVGSLGRGRIVARSKAMADVMALAAKIAPLPSTVLVQGESGSGKELLARGLHESSPRAERPFVAVNCAVIPLTLLESELFGHERGAFTGAESRRIGYFEAAGEGTIFLDEISETSLDLQVKLLRVLQERVFRRVGGSAEIPTRARIIVSTNRNLEEEVRKGRFRQDLYYRLAVIMIRLPPLRERRQDVSFLAQQFLVRFAKEFGKPVRTISPAAMEVLLRRPWPGNVRELENSIERAVALAEGKELGPEDLAPLEPDLLDGPTPPTVRPSAQRYAEARDTFDRSYLRSLLSAADGNMTEASRISGIARQNLYKKMKKLGIGRDTPTAI